jgi:hypothetical protein
LRASCTLERGSLRISRALEQNVRGVYGPAQVSMPVRSNKLRLEEFR